MATNHNRTLYKDYLSALLGKEAAEEQVRILNSQCRKLELYTANLEEAGEKQQAVIEEKEKRSASNYAIIKTYLETCIRNGINEVDALIHLCVGAPYSAGDLFGMGSCEQ